MEPVDESLERMQAGHTGTVWFGALVAEVGEARAFEMLGDLRARGVVEADTLAADMAWLRGPLSDAIPGAVDRGLELGLTEVQINDLAVMRLEQLLRPPKPEDR